MNELVYSDPRWNIIRKRVYQRAGYECERCGASNVILHAHHIKPISGVERLSDINNNFDEDNLICLCQECHGEEHGRIIEV